MQGRFKMEYRLFTIVRYNYNYRDYNSEMCRCVDLTQCKSVCFPKCVAGIAKRRKDGRNFVNVGFSHVTYRKTYVDMSFIYAN